MAAPAPGVGAVSTEIEAKFIIPDRETFEALKAGSALGGYRLEPGRLVPVNDTYLDTPGRALLAAGYACRRREQEGGIIMTLKGTAPAAGAVHRREELEVRLAGDSPPAQWPPGEARDTALAVARGEPLEALFHLHQERFVSAAFDGERRVATVSLDTVEVTHGAARQGYRELEIELAPDGAEADLAALASWVEGHYRVLPSPRSKFERALEIVEAESVRPPSQRRARGARQPAPREESISLEAPPGLSEEGLLRELSAMGYAPRQRGRKNSTEVFFDSHEGALFRKGYVLGHSFENHTWRLLKGETVEAEQAFESTTPPAEGEIPAAVSRLTGSRVSIPFLQGALQETEYWLRGFAARPLRLFVRSWTFNSPFQEVAPQECLSLTARGVPQATGLSYFVTLLRERMQCGTPAGTVLEQGLVRLGLPVPGASIPAAFLVVAQDTLSSACGRILGGEAWRMRANAAGALHDLDIEFVHVMRVATRRARFAVRLFAPFLPPDAGPTLRAELAWIAGLLGEARDLDVFLAGLSKQLSLLDAPSDFEEAIRDRLARMRARAQESLAAAVRSDRFARLLASLEHPVAFQNELGAEVSVRRLAARRVDKAFAKLGRWTGRPTESLADADLHALRILFKRLRYTCEFFRPLFSREIGGLIGTCVAYQDCLGALQNSAVALALLQGIAEESSSEASPGFLLALGALIQLQRDLRRAQRGEFLGLWESAADIGARWKRIRDLGERM
jgi:CHAD domain-containing protein